jgi:hypothetical protein
MTATLLLALLLAAADKPLVFEVTLEAGKIHEECLRVERGASRRYAWSANAAVDFNIHHHRGDDVFYPVKRDGVAKFEGTFTAKSSEDYCWMWTAKGPARIRGSIEK